jgi:hypothetical protein
MCQTGGSDETDDELAVEYNSVDLGLLYRISSTIRVGLMLKSVLGFSLKKKYDSFAPPKSATLGVSIRRKKQTFSFDSEFIFGRFGGVNKQTAEIWLLRAGLEHEISRLFRLRGGLVYPVIARTSSLGDLRADIPWPKVGGSIGIGLALKRFNIDLALYGDPAKSYVEQELVLGAMATLTYKF